MSHKAFYQTFFQTEQLFRRADDVLTFPAMTGPSADGLAIEVQAPPVNRPKPAEEVPVAVPAVQIIDPVVPPAIDVSLTRSLT